MQATLVEPFHKLPKGEIEPNVAIAMATVAKAIIDVAAVATIDGQVAELERLVAKQATR